MTVRDYTGRKTVPDPRYTDSRIYLYGVTDANFMLLPGPKVDKKETLVEVRPWSSNDFELAVIYGYGYQGHCYELDRPRMFLIRKECRRAAASGCGYGDEYVNSAGQSGLPTVARYSMWIVDKLDETMQIDVRNDTYETLVVEGNLPTNRQPSAYAIRFTMGHRSGKLTE